MNKSFVFVSAAVYMDHNIEEIGSFIPFLANQLNTYFKNSEIILVNDNPSEIKSEQIKEIVKDIKGVSITLVNMGYRHELEAAMSAGVDMAIGDYVYEFDSVYRDYPETLIYDIFAESQKGYDLVSASSNRKEAFSSRLFYKLYNKYHYGHVEIQTESFRILSRRLINRVKSMNKTIPYRKALYVSCGLKQKNIKYNPINNKKRKKDRYYRVNLAINSLLLFTDFGYRVSTIMVFVMLACAMFMGVYTVYIYTTGKPIEGWTTTLLFLSVALFGLFAILAIVIKYLQLAVDLMFKRTSYVFESVEKLSK